MDNTAQPVEVPQQGVDPTPTDVPPSAPPKVLSKKELKKQRREAMAQNVKSGGVSPQAAKEQMRLQEKVRRLINQGVPPNQIPAHLAKERYDNMPLPKKLQYLESLVSNIARGFGSDIRKLQDNDKVLANVLDVNFSAFSKLLAMAGITPEKQKEVLEETEKELQEKARVRAEELQKQQAEARKAAIEKSIIKKVEAQPASDAPAQVPEGAKVFGGDSEAPLSTEEQADIEKTLAEG